MDSLIKDQEKLKKIISDEIIKIRLADSREKADVMAEEMLTSAWEDMAF